MEFKDKAGHLLQPGDLIIYGHALGRCAGLQYGKVVAIQRAKNRYGWDDNVAEEHLKVKIKVQGVDTDWKSQEPKLLRRSVLEFNERVLRITRDQVSKEVLSLLDTVKPEDP